MLPHQTAGTPVPYTAGIRIAQTVMRPDAQPAVLIACWLPIFPGVGQDGGNVYIFGLFLITAALEAGRLPAFPALVDFAIAGLSIRGFATLGTSSYPVPTFLVTALFQTVKFFQIVQFFQIAQIDTYAWHCRGLLHTICYYCGLNKPIISGKP